MNMNGVAIQEQLRTMSSVSVPWIQKTYGLRYSEARNFLTQLQQRGWASRVADGISYKVQKRYFRLRKLEQSEVAELIENFTPDCLAAIECSQGRGATFDMMEDIIRSESDTSEAIAYLRKRRLIWEYRGMFFCCVSKQTVKVLGDLVNTRRGLRNFRRMVGESDGDEDYSALFKPLFE